LRTYKVPEAATFCTAFCSECGGVLPAAFNAIKIYLVPAGSVDTPLNVKPTVQIHTASKAPWAIINETIPQYPEMPPREQIFTLMFEKRES